jgi:hypothetical protein
MRGISPPRAWLVAGALALAAPAGAAVPDAKVVLEVLEPPAPGRAPEAAPARFALLEDGTLFVGGTSEVFAGRLEKGESREIEKLIGRVRKLPGLGAQTRLGPGETRWRLSLPKELTITATGELDQAPASLRPLAELLRTLEAFLHPSLHAYHPAQYLLSARAAPILGGCRPWTFTELTLAEALASPRIVASRAAAGWSTGALAANVCYEDQTFHVALRPLLPGERP